MVRVAWVLIWWIVGTFANQVVSTTFWNLLDSWLFELLSQAVIQPINILSCTSVEVQEHLCSRVLVEFEVLV